jgi:copper chaperone NosL
MLYGEQECDRCRMIIGEPRFASAVVLADGEVRRFDDVGCLREWARDRAPEEISQVWVHDVASGEWRTAGEVVFVRGSLRVTPMGSGWVALAEPAGAPAVLGEEVYEGPLRWEDLTRR